MARAFVAGPLFNVAQLKMLESIANRLEAIGINTFLPHRDVGLLWKEGELPTIAQALEIFRMDRDALLTSDLLVAWIDGWPDNDSGTCVEMGIAYSAHISIYALRTDPRPYLNPMIIGVCGEGSFVFSSLDDLVNAVREHFIEKHT